MANATNTSANRYKGEDIDPDGDGRVSRADHASNASNADAVNGQNPLRHGEEVDAPADAHHERPQPGKNISESGGTWNVEAVGESAIPVRNEDGSIRYKSDPMHSASYVESITTGQNQWHTLRTFTLDLRGLQYVQARLRGQRTNENADGWAEGRIVAQSDGTELLNGSFGNTLSDSPNWIGWNSQDVTTLGVETFNVQIQPNQDTSSSWSGELLAEEVRRHYTVADIE